MSADDAARFQRENQLLGEIVTALKDNVAQLTQDNTDLKALIVEQLDKLEVANDRADAMERRALKAESELETARAQAVLAATAAGSGSKLSPAAANSEPAASQQRPVAASASQRQPAAPSSEPAMSKTI